MKSVDPKLLSLSLKSVPIQGIPKKCNKYSQDPIQVVEVMQQTCQCTDCNLVVAFFSTLSPKVLSVLLYKEVSTIRTQLTKNRFDFLQNLFQMNHLDSCIPTSGFHCSCVVIGKGGNGEKQVYL